MCEIFPSATPKYINKKKHRIGHLFQGRYKAVLIDADSYLVELVRYIHNNPVRAGMVKNALDYKWSSHQVYLGLQELPFLTTDWLLAQFAKRETTARRKFAEFVEKGGETGHRKDFYLEEHDSLVLGNDLFVEKVLADKTITRKPEFNAIVKYACEQFGVTEKQLRSPSRQRKMAEIRGIVGWHTTRLEAATLSAVSKRFNRDLATISRAVRNIEKRMLKSKEMKKQLDGYRKELRDNVITHA